MNSEVIDKYNPYGSWRSGQKEAITEILELLESGQKVIELNAPTASGKSLDLFVLGRILSCENGLDKVVYTTPLVALVDQLDREKKFASMPVLRGRRNYVCANDSHYTADECPFGAKKAAIAKCPNFYRCLYYIAMTDWERIPFGATTFAKYMADPNVHLSAQALLIDESASIEKALLERSTLKLPDEVDIDNLRPSMIAYFQRVNDRVDDLKEKVAIYVEDNNLKAAMETKKLQRHWERVSGKCAKGLTQNKMNTFIL